jgi:CheY-like chemotaxis protein
MTDVLIIDDDDVFGQLTLQRVETMAWSVAFHHGPFGSVNAIRAVQPRLVIMDVNMPGLDGTAIWELLRRQGMSRHTKVLLMSSLDQRQLDDLAAQHAMDGALHKSASTAQLSEMIQSLIGRPARA